MDGKMNLTWTTMMTVSLILLKNSSVPILSMPPINLRMQMEIVFPML